MGKYTKEELELERSKFNAKVENIEKASMYEFFIVKVSKDDWQGEEVSCSFVDELCNAPAQLGAGFHDCRKIKSITHTPIFAYDELGILTTIIYE